MRSPSPSSLPAPAAGGVRRDRALAEEQLGASHPLALLLASLETSLEQLSAIAAVALLGSALLLGEHRTPLPLLVAAGAAAAVPAVRWLARRAALHDACIDLLIGRRDGVRLRVLERERRRLAAPRHSASLAHSIAELLRAAERPEPHAVFDPRVIRSVAPELRAVAQRLLTAAPAVQGVALAERLLRNGTSPLYGSEPEPLRRELGRARFLLESR